MNMLNFPRAKVANIIAYWRCKVTDADMDAVRTMVNDAIDKSGLDATATIEEDDSYADMVCMGHKPIKATIKINNAFPSVRMVNGTLVKGVDTITVIFQRRAGVFDCAKHHELMQVRHENADKMSTEEALAAGDALPWEGESVEFSARTNGKAREYRKRHWYPYEGGIPGYGLDHIGGHYGYADTWANLAPDFAAYVGAIAKDLGYAGKLAGWLAAA